MMEIKSDIELSIIENVVQSNHYYMDKIRFNLESILFSEDKVDLILCLLENINDGLKNDIRKYIDEKAKNQK